MQICLAPEIVVAILDDEFPEHIPLFELAVEPLLSWDLLIYYWKMLLLSISGFLAYSGTDFHHTDNTLLRTYKFDASRRRLPQAMSNLWLF